MNMDGTTVDDELASTIYELYRTIRRGSPFTVGDYNDLSILSLLRQSGSLRVTVIADRTGLTQPGVTTILRRLEARGDVTLAADESDARATLVTVTTTGAARLSAMEKHRVDQLSSALCQVSDRDANKLRDAQSAIHALTQLIEKEGE